MRDPSSIFAGLDSTVTQALGNPAIDELGQVISGEKRWPNGARVAGQQFEYEFDAIGNRTEKGNGVASK